jgi:hypothetical protein
MENGKVKFEGEVVRLGDRDYTIPSLSVKQAKNLWANMLELDKGVTAETLPSKYELALPIILAAMSRNYPDLKLEELEDLVDMKNFRVLMRIVSGQSGLATGGAEPAAVAKAPAN